MPLISIPPVQIEIDIPDLILGTVTLKRKATVFTMTYNQATKTLTLTWIVSYTDLQGIKGLSSYSKESIADNSTMVDVATGAIIHPVTTTDAATGETTTSYGDGNYIGQYDWFNMIAETLSIKVHNLIRQYGLTATWD
jgi:hypothetical protein